MTMLNYFSNAPLVSLASPYLLITISFFFTALCLITYFLLQPSLVKDKNYLSQFKLEYLFWGQFGYFPYLFAAVQSQRSFSTGSDAAILNYTWPIFTLLFAKFFFTRTKLKRPSIEIFVEAVAVFLGFISVVLVATQGSLTLNLNLKGLMWGLIAGGSYGLFSSYSTTVDEKQQPIFLLTAILASCILAIPFAIFEWKTTLNVSLTDVGLAALLGIGLNGVGYIMWTRALRLASISQIRISKIVSLVFALPILSLVVLAIFLGERRLFQPYFFLSALLIFISNVFARNVEGIVSIFSVDKRS